MQRWGLAACACAWIFSLATTAAAAADDAPTLSTAPILSTDLPASRASLVPTAEASTVLTEAKRLLDSGKANEAYVLLADHEVAFAGTPEFDYLFGIAALDTHRAKEAAFALQRVVAEQPDFLGARMDLARAQLELGQRSPAREQFRYLLTQQPPEETRVVIQRYLDSLDKRNVHVSARWSALAQVGAGYDSNANGSTSEQSFLGFALDPHNVATSSSFGEVAVNGGNVLSFSPTFGVISSLDLTHRANADASFVDQSVSSLASTAVWLHGEYRFSGGLDGYFGWLDGADHERGVNVNLSASRQFGGDYEGAVSLRAGTLEYRDDTLRILDTDRYLAGISLTRFNLGERGARLGATLLLGTDDAKHAASPYGNDRYGIRFFGSMALRPNAVAYAEISRMSTSYDGSFFGGRRDDDQFALTLAADLQDFPARRWTFTPRLRYMKNDSNISLYEYDRIEAMVYLRRGF
ncbi:MAG: tetratricopeptide repeat protein [Gammaproteobacteria bacterium]